jgi:hypothetical protein
MKFLKNFREQAMGAAKYSAKAATIVVVGGFTIAGLKKAAEKTPIELDEQVIDRLTPK